MAVSRLQEDGEARKHALADIALLVENPKLDGLFKRLASLAQPAAKTPVVLVRLVGPAPPLRDFVLRGLEAGVCGEAAGAFGSVQDAVEAVGPTRVRDLAQLLCFRALCAEATRDGGVSGREIVRHAVATASGLRRMRFYAQLPADDVFGVALLHNAGLLALAAAHGAAYASLVDRLERAPTPLVDAERGVFGHDHQFVGAALLEHYEYPAAYIEAAARHHRPLESPSRLAESISLCAAVAERLGFCVARGATLPELGPEEAKRFAMAPGGLERIATDMRDEVAALQSAGI